MSDDIRTNVILMGRYQVQGELGRGGMGSVYLAYDLQYRRSVAIKVARLPGEEARAQFRREALYLQKLHHHSLPRVWDTFSDDQRDFLVMEYIPGDDLESLVQRQGPQPEWLVLRWADELLDVLDYLHTQTPPIIHRDVKPGNIKLRQNDTLVLVDFGIAREYIPESSGGRGLSAISPGFSPPEQYSDQMTDARTDVYAAGATFYYLLSGHAPAPAPDRQSGAAGLAPVSKLAAKTSQATEKVVTQALELEPSARWSNAAEMQRLTVAASRKLTSAAAASAAEPPPLLVSPAKPAISSAPVVAAPPRRRAGLAGLLGLLGVGLLAVAAFLWLNSTRQTPIAPAAVAVQPRNQATTAITPAATATVQLSSPADDQATATQPALAAAPTAAAEGAVISTLVPVTTTLPLTPTATLPLVSNTSTATFVPVLATSTKTPTATPKPAVVPPKATATPKPSGLAAVLLAPAAAVSINGPQTFSWQANRALAGSEAFELVFWRPGQDAMRDGFGPAGVTQVNQITVDLNLADANLESLFDSGDYLWGVLLVETAPSYRRLAVASEGRPFRFELGGGAAQPTPDPG